MSPLRFLGVLFLWTGAALAGTALTVNPNGTFSLDGATFGLAHFNRDWQRTSFSTAKPESAGKRWTFRGSKPAEGKAVSYEGTLDQEGADVFQTAWRVTLPEDLPTAALCLEIHVPIEYVAGRKVRLDDEELTLPAAFGETILFSRQAHRLVLPTRNGNIAIEGGFSAFAQDQRRWEGDTFCFRLGLARDAASVDGMAVAKLDAKIAFTPFASTPISLAGVANRALADDKADDGKGGWTDQGPENDLRSLPPGPLKAAGVSFEIASGGKAALVFQGDAAAPAVIPLPDHPSLANLYLLHGLAWAPRAGVEVGRVTAVYADGTEKSFPVITGREVGDWWSPYGLPNGAEGWTGRNPNGPIGLYVSRFVLDRKPLREIRLERTAKTTWMIAGLAGSEDDIDINLAPAPVTIRAGRQWAPYDYALSIKPGSVFDFSALSDPPAGKYGPLQVSADGHFAFAQRPGVPVRFWGVNFCFGANFLPHAVADAVAERLMRSGYNAVRFHHYDSELVKKGGRSYELDPAKLDQLDYLFAALKACGLSITIDLYTYRAFSKDEIPDLGADFRTEIKELLPISDRAYESFLRFARNLLTHVNPYTGLTWAADPALIAVCPVNEDTQLAFPSGDQPALRALYEKAYAAWLAKQDQAVAANDRSARLRFLIETRRNFDARIRQDLRAMGLQALLTGSNFLNEPVIGLLREHYDFVDNHGYWDHPKFPMKAWALPYQFRQTSATRNLAELPRGLMPSRLFGKPYVVTEFNFVHPNSYRAEGGLLVSAYACLQDWDALYNFDYAANTEEQTGPHRAGLFDIAADPIGLLADRVSALMFRRGDVRPASKAVAFSLDPEEALAIDTERPPGYPPGFSLTGLRARLGTVIGKPGDAWENVSVEKTFTSETGELTLRSDEGIFQLVTPRAEGFVLPGGAKSGGKVLSVANGPEFGAFTLISVDGKPLAESARILLLHLTDALNTDATFADKSRRLLTEPGKLPHLVRRGSADVRLDLRGEWTVWQVAADGTRLKKQPFTREGGALLLKLGADPDETPALAYELARESVP